MCSGRQGDLLDWRMEENFSKSKWGRAGSRYDKIWNAFWGAFAFKMGLLKMG